MPNTGCSSGAASRGAGACPTRNGAVSSPPRSRPASRTALTVVDASGQWRDGKGAIGREGAKLLIVLAEPDANAVRRTEEIAEAYKRTFDQQSVLRAIETVCAAF